MKWLNEKKKEVTWIDFINKDDNRTISIIPRYSDYTHLPKKDTYTIYYTYKGISSINKLPIDRFLYENDCKFQIVDTDVIIDIDNYEKPMTQFLDSMFIQLIVTAQNHY